MFKNIELQELRSLKWTSQTEKFNATPNIVSMTARFNDLAGWVANQILHSPTPNSRIQQIMYFINVAKYCLDYGDFNGLFVIIGGLKSTPVLRLKRTWAVFYNNLDD